MLSAFGWIIVSVGIIFGGWIVSGLLPRRGIESPKFRVVKKMNGYEIREYDDYIVAEVKVAGKADDALIPGFRILLDFISGNNVRRSPSMVAMSGPAATSEKMPMTTPVLQMPEERENVVAFVMPSKYTIETLPAPNDSRVSARRVPKHLEAVHRFSGYARSDSVGRHTRMFSDQLRADGLQPEPPFLLSQYDPPWTPPFMRRNELLAKVEWVPAVPSNSRSPTGFPSSVLSNSFRPRPEASLGSRSNGLGRRGMLSLVAKYTPDSAVVVN